MSGYSNLRGAEIRAKLDHPVIDADAHIVECQFALNDCLEQVGGKALAARAAKAAQNGGAHGASVKGFWWGLSSGEHTSDRALAMHNLRDFAFVNPAMFHLSMNPDYFVGTVVEDATRKLLQEQTRRKQRVRA
jgi:hypothetical protein